MHGQVGDLDVEYDAIIILNDAKSGYDQIQCIRRSAFQCCACFLSINLDSSGYIFLVYMFAVFIHFSIKHLISAVSNFRCLMKMTFWRILVLRS